MSKSRPCRGPVIKRDGSALSQRAIVDRLSSEVLGYETLSLTPNGSHEVWLELTPEGTESSSESKRRKSKAIYNCRTKHRKILYSESTDVCTYAVHEQPQSGGRSAEEEGTIAVYHAGGDDVATPLHRAAREGTIAVVEELLRQGAAVDQVRRGDCATPLHLAAREGHLAVVAALLGCGADVRKAMKLETGVIVEDATCDGATPLCLAILHGHSAVILYIMRRESGGSGPLTGREALLLAGAKLAKVEVDKQRTMCTSGCPDMGKLATGMGQLATGMFHWTWRILNHGNTAGYTHAVSTAAATDGTDGTGGSGSGSGRAALKRAAERLAQVHRNSLLSRPATLP